VTASGYQQTSTGWTLISSTTVGQPGQWFWYSVEACSFTVTQLKPLPSSAEPFDSMRVSLLETPALGCSKTYHATWKPTAISGVAQANRRARRRDRRRDRIDGQDRASHAAGRGSRRVLAVTR
jgi:hypothetical protein